MEVNGFWIKEQHKYMKTLTVFSSKHKFPKSPENIKKNRSEYNGCRSALKFI